MTRRIWRLLDRVSRHLPTSIQESAELVEPSGSERAPSPADDSIGTPFPGRDGSTTSLPSLTRSGSSAPSFADRQMFMAQLLRPRPMASVHGWLPVPGHLTLERRGMAAHCRRKHSGAIVTAA